MKQGRGWVVFEGFGSPVGMDFYAKVGEGVYSVGESQALSGGKAIITVKFPEMHRKSPQGAKSPVIKLQLKKVLSDGLDQVVATSASGDLVYTTQEPGAYRAEVTIQPKHLEDWLGPFSDLADDTYPWIITNHIYLDP